MRTSMTWCGAVLVLLAGCDGGTRSADSISQTEQQAIVKKAMEASAGKLSAPPEGARAPAGTNPGEFEKRRSDAMKSMMSGGTPKTSN